MTKPVTNIEQQLHFIAPYFIVDGIFKSAEFYRDKLGFTLTISMVSHRSSSWFIEIVSSLCSRVLVRQAMVGLIAG